MNRSPYSTIANEINEYARTTGPLGGVRSLSPQLDTVTWTSLVTTSIIPLILVALRCASATTSNISYLLLAAYAILGPRQTIQSLFLLWFFNMLNHGLAPTASWAFLLRHIVVATALLSTVIHVGFRRYASGGTLSWATLGLSTFLFAHSTICSMQPDVSIAKTLTFSATTTVLLACWTALDLKSRKLVTAFIFTGLAAMMFSGLPLIWSPVGYFRNGRGFQGIFVHPQNFGPTMAVLGVYSALRILTTPQLRPLTYITLTAAATCIFLSKARIGGLALLAGISGALLIHLPLRVWNRTRASERASVSQLTFATVGIALLALAIGPQITLRLEQFINKGRRQDSLLETAMASRGASLEQMLVNIDQRPGVGVGFGVNANTDYYLIARDPIFNLPVMATVEKGVMPVAIVEETGVLGAVVVFPWLALLLVYSIRGGILCTGVLIAVLVTNIAESNLFAPGGQGMFQLLMASWAATGALASPTYLRLPQPLRAQTQRHLVPV